MRLRRCSLYAPLRARLLCTSIYIVYIVYTPYVCARLECRACNYAERSSRRSCCASSPCIYGIYTYVWRQTIARLFMCSRTHAESLRASDTYPLFYTLNQIIYDLSVSWRVYVMWYNSVQLYYIRNSLNPGELYKQRMEINSKREIIALGKVHTCDASIRVHSVRA